MKSTNEKTDYLVKNFRLVEARKSMGLTQSELAKSSGLAKANYCIYEQMKTNPPQEVKIKLSQVLNQSVERLFPKSIDNHYATRAKSKDIYDNCEQVDIDFSQIPQETSIEELVDKKILSETANKLLKRLEPRQREILELRAKEYTLKEIADVYEVSIERVRQIESEAIKRIRPSYRRHCVKTNSSF